MGSATEGSHLTKNHNVVVLVSHVTPFMKPNEPTKLSLISRCLIWLLLHLNGWNKLPTVKGELPIWYKDGTTLSGNRILFRGDWRYALGCISSMAWHPFPLDPTLKQ